MTTGLLLWAAGLLVALFALRRWLAPAFLSPVVLVAASMIALALGGAWFYQDVALAPGGAGVQLVIGDQLVQDTTRLLLLATSAFLVGSTLGVVRRRGVAQGPAGFRAVVLPEATLVAIAAGCVLPILYTLFVPGVPYLLDRPYYLADAFGGGAAAIAGQLSIAAVLGCGLLASVWRGAGRVLAVALALVYFVSFFALATRVMALAPVLFALGAFAGSPSRRTRIGLAVSAVASVALIGLPLFLRNQVHHGLIPYVHELSGFLSATAGYDVVALNILISFAIIGVTAYVQPTFPSHDLFVSLNPLPGGMAGWYDIADVHRLNVYTPYGAIGELGNVGPAAVVGYFVALGLVMAWLDRRVRAHLVAGRQGPALLVVGLVALFCLYNQQYNLRQSTRMVYYALAIDLALMAWTWFRSRPRDPDDDVRDAVEGTAADELSAGRPA